MAPDMPLRTRIDSGETELVLVPTDGTKPLFAAVTDDPPAEIAAAGHDRCIIPIKRANVDAWLHPQVSNLGAQYAILDDRERP